MSGNSWELKFEEGMLIEPGIMDFCTGTDGRMKLETNVAGKEKKSFHPADLSVLHLHALAFSAYSGALAMAQFFN